MALPNEATPPSRGSAKAVAMSAALGDATLAARRSARYKPFADALFAVSWFYTSTDGNIRGDDSTPPTDPTAGQTGVISGTCGSAVSGLAADADTRYQLATSVLASKAAKQHVSQILDAYTICTQRYPLPAVGDPNYTAQLGKQTECEFNPATDPSWNGTGPVQSTG